MNDSTETWLPIPDLPGYEVSDHGRARGPSGELNQRLYETRRGGPKYFQVYLPKPIGRNYYVHRLVLEAFVGKAPKGQQCRHLNGTSTDNRLENLQWGTPSEDNYDRIRHGTHQHAKKTHCKYGHPLDGEYLNPDGSVHQRVCLTCRRIHNREMKAKARAARTTCPKGHPFDGVRYNADGSVRQRYCKTCAHAALEQGRVNRWARDRKQ